VTDQATFAWICDVYVDEAVRGRGVGSQLMEAILADVRLSRVPRMLLATTSAAALYERFGFAPIDHPERWLERRLPPDPE
jgi:N-acetylglutamate synthase-like GNAT family acetyltransferase